MVCADTWATEIGTMGKFKTIDVLSLHRVEQGTSGGVSLAGCTGTILGAAVISFSALYWITFNHLSFILLILIAGFAGSILDSVLGTSIQTQFRCNVCKKNVEAKIHCGNLTTKIKGIKWISNDAVNFAASLCGAIFGIIIFEILSFK